MQRLGPESQGRGPAKRGNAKAWWGIESRGKGWAELCPALQRQGVALLCKGITGHRKATKWWPKKGRGMVLSGSAKPGIGGAPYGFALQRLSSASRNPATVERGVAKQRHHRALHSNEVMRQSERNHGNEN